MTYLIEQIHNRTALSSIKHIIKTHVVSFNMYLFISSLQTLAGVPNLVYMYP